jgi:hypothetical protein
MTVKMRATARGRFLEMLTVTCYYSDRKIITKGEKGYYYETCIRQFY